MKVSKDSKLKDIYSKPVGKDIIDKLSMQLGVSPKLLLNPVTGNLRLSFIERLSGKKSVRNFMTDFLEMVNSEPGVPFHGKSEIHEKWWKEAVFYQIYPSSFCDSDGDGEGDLKGILSKLDILKDLGVDALWLNPVYDSPWDDNGYDIRDYRKIHEKFGTMEDMGKLINEVHKRDMRIIMDLVVNHTSDEHEWFKKALSDKDSPYRDYYFIRPGKEGKEPNNWKSFFSGPAWKKVGEDEYAMHIFSEKQMDLNWDNEAVRKEVTDIVRFWMDKGVDGFRLDVINFISKKPGLPDGNETIGELINYTGLEHYYYGPNLHRYLRELKEKAFDPYGGFAVGETPGVGIEAGKLLTQEGRGELDLIFGFDHLETPGHTRMEDYVYDINYLKDYFIRLEEGMSGKDWISIFTDNHDNPRMISKIDHTGLYSDKLSKVILTMLLTLKGTPFIFQGQETGRKNADFKDIGDIRDIESLNLYKELTGKGKSSEEAFRVILSGTRDHARIPIAWNESENGGFTEGQPWIKQSMDYKDNNVEKQMKDPYSVWNWTKNLINLRKQDKTLIYGDVVFHNKDKKNWFSYERISGNSKYLIEMNLSNKMMRRPLNIPLDRIILSSEKNPERNIFRPYEVRISDLGQK